MGARDSKGAGSGKPVMRRSGGGRRPAVPGTPAGWLFVILVVAALWAWDRWSAGEKGKKAAAPPVAEKRESPKTGPAKPAAREATPRSGDRTAARVPGQWESLPGPALVENGGNDGDSFFLRFEGGQERFRLYFVDTPETTRRFPDRLGHQARYFNGVDTDALIAGGKEARSFTLDLLRRHPIEAWTRWERVMDSDRYHVIVRFPGRDGKPWLHEELVKAGLARIYTMPTDLPDGTPKRQHLDQLKSLEAGARRAKSGLWGK